MEKQIQILLTNDDGIQSPGLWAAAGALSELGYVHVVAPRDQFSGAGRSLPSTSDGIITPQQMQVNGKLWTVYSVGGTPAQAILHAICEILPERPDLVVSGINYGENLGVGITVSGTVGAAMEGAGNGIPALAVSLETDESDHLSYSTDIDFSAAAYFTSLFGRLMLERHLPDDVDLLKVDVPCDATVADPLGGEPAVPPGVLCADHTHTGRRGTNQSGWATGGLWSWMGRRQTRMCMPCG